MTRLLVIHLALLLLTSCGRAAAVKIETAAAQQPKLVSALPRQVDLTKIGHIAPKGRVQDLEYNQLPLVQELIAQGKQSVPYLISKLDDDMKIDGAVVDYWSDIRVGDVALIILTDFFTDSSWQRATIAGVGWDEFLERENRKSLTGEQVLHSYVAKHGRKKIKDRWIATWAQHSNGIYWDEKERCFRLTGS